MIRPPKRKATPRSLTAEAALTGTTIRLKYGSALGSAELARILQDRTCVPYPCEVRFDAQPLLPGEFAHALAKGLAPEEGYTIFVHPKFQAQPAKVPYLVLYQMALVRYGEAASTDAAETFGAHALGLGKEEYYRALCELSEQVGGDELV